MVTNRVKPLTKLNIDFRTSNQMKTESMLLLFGNMLQLPRYIRPQTLVNKFSRNLRRKRFKSLFQLLIYWMFQKMVAV